MTTAASMQDRSERTTATRLRGATAAVDTGRTAPAAVKLFQRNCHRLSEEKVEVDLGGLDLYFFSPQINYLSLYLIRYD